MSRSVAAWELYEKGKKTEEWLRSQLNIYTLEMQHALLWSEYMYSVDIHINFWTAVGDIYCAFLPGFGFVGTETLGNAAHRHIWQPSDGSGQ